VSVIAEYVRESGISPQQVLCSPARRTRETLEGVAPGGETLIEPELYGASAAEIMERLRRVPDDVGSVMVVGHNPALQILVLRLADANGPHTNGADLADVQRKFPTGGLATLSFECSWGELGRGRAQLVAFMRPKALH